MVRENEITVKEAAAILNRSNSWVHSLIQRKKVEARKFGPIWLVDKASLEAYIEAREVDGECSSSPSSS